MSLKDKVAIITGSSAGIGRSTALLFAQRGALVTIHGRRQEKLDEVAEEILTTSGRKPVIVCGDIEDSNVRKQLIDLTVEQHGRIDVLVNNAGYVTPGGWAAPVDSLRQMFECHCVAPFELCQLSMPYLLKTKGSVVMVSSVAGLKAMAMSVPYCTVKAGMDNMMRSLALEVAKDGVRINSLNPGLIATDILRDTPVGTNYDLLSPPDKPFHPNGRVGKPEEMATVIAFLASDDASMITGATLAADGGLTAALKF